MKFTSIESLKKFTASLRELPRTVALRVPQEAAPEISAAAATTFAAGQDPYGVGWAPGVNGDSVSLVKTGALRKFVAYRAEGQKLRIALGVPYAKYQIGKRLVFPRQGGVLPPVYVRTLSTVAERVIREALGRAA